MNRLRELLRDEPVRVYVYGLAVAIVALLVGYGRLAADVAPLWLAAVTAALAIPSAEGARARVTPWQRALDEGVPLPAQREEPDPLDS